MKELTMNEVQEVNGGILPFLIGLDVGLAIGNYVAYCVLNK